MYLGDTDLAHLSLTGWRWTQWERQPDSYFSVLHAFMDRKDSYYSIHQIGVCPGGWGGPGPLSPASLAHGLRCSAWHLNASVAALKVGAPRALAGV